MRRRHLCQARGMGHYGGVELDELVLSSERLTLRPWRRADAPVVHEALQDRATHKFLKLPDPYQPSDAVEFVTEIAPAAPRAGTGLARALVETATGRIVGSADLRLPAPRRTAAEIGYLVYAPARGNGYAAEVSRTLAAWAFEHGVGRVEIRCAVANLASAKSALNAGFRFEGVLRGDIAAASGPADGAVFGRLPGDPDGPVARRFAALPPAGLSDGVLTLRAMQPGDAPAILEQESDPLTVGIGFSAAAPTAADIGRLAERAGLDWLVGGAAPFAIVDVASGRVAGSLRLRLAGPPNVGGIGYAVHPAFRGRGYTTRALRLLVPWAFGTAGFARLELGAKPANIASQQAALRAGFEPDGIRRGRLRNIDGTFADEVRFALVNPRLG
jgi:RimJ/RimL family protein N-acetyltransferase